MKWRALVASLAAAALAAVATLAPHTVQAQPQDGFLTVHIIAHSHCDPGWLNTFEGYYTSEVKLILDGVLKELTSQPHRKFVWSEISFFNRWYESLDKDHKEQFKSLIRKGQLEFVNGGWVQNDESAPDPVAIINQMTTGHEYILKNFGVSPRIAWQIDPFGHSGVTPSMWSLMGFDAMVINRIHHHLKDSFKIRKQMEFIWRGVDVGQKTDMFTHVLHTHYSAPPGYDWEEGGMTIDNNNVGSRARDLSSLMRQRAMAYRTNHLLVPFGDDFKFKLAGRQFENMDRLMEHINSNSAQYNMRIRYSTLSDYFEAVAGANVKFPVVTGDFFPYADNEDSYWTGYYTTRPLLKQKSRKLNHILRACEQLLVLVRSSPHSNLDTQQQNLPAHYWENKFKEVENARMETALFLHHDAITGTSRAHVVQDYQHRMDTASEQLMQIMARMIEHLLTKEPNAPPALTPDPLVFGPPTPGETDPYHPVVYYNSLGWVRREVVSLRVLSRCVRIFNSDNKEIPSQVDAYWGDLSNSELAPTQHLFTVSFIVEVPPLGAATYYVLITSTCTEPTRRSQSQTSVYVSTEQRVRGNSMFKSKYLTYELNDHAQQFIENAFLKIFIDSTTGMVRAVEQKTPNGKSFDFRQKFGRYPTSRSGAYLFRPQGRLEWWGGEPTTIRITRGPIVSTVAVKYRSFDVVTQLFGGMDETSAEMGDHVSITSTVGTDSNTELICSFASDNFPTGREFFTNSGVEFLKRQTKAAGINEPANYYPMVVGARMVSPSQQRSYTILSSHTMAAGSQSEGELHILMHRSLAQDDGRGLSEPVHDTSRLDIPLWISFEHGMAEPTFRVKSIRLNNPLRVFYKLPSSHSTDLFLKHDHVDSPDQWGERQHVTLKPLKAPLPPNVHLLTLLARDSVSDDIVARFQHLDSAKDTAWVSSFDDLFESTYTVSEVRRATLSLNTILPMNGHRKRAIQFLPTDDAPISPYTMAPDADAAGGGASQNTNEEGVFLSQAAMEKLRQDQLEAAKMVGKNKRRLLEHMEQEPEMVDVRLALDSETSEMAAARRLFAAASVSTTPLFVVKPLQLQTYVFKLSGSEWAEATEGVMVGIGATEKGTPATPTKKKSPAASSGAKKTPPLPTKKPVTEPDGTDRSKTKTSAAAGVDAGGTRPTSSRASVDPTDNILHGHEHTVIPGRTREAWRLIPSRWEYIVVLLASLGGVAFFLHALRVLSRGGGGGGGGGDTEMHRRGRKIAL